jgi:hypothetical protein
LNLFPQDQDGSHIKGLIINFIHHNWPELLRLPFIEEFITPIVKATKGNQSQSFFSLPEFFEWKKNTDNWHTYKVKYYKGMSKKSWILKEFGFSGKQLCSEVSKRHQLFEFPLRKNQSTIFP